jgi:hypothetical protein
VSDFQRCFSIHHMKLLNVPEFPGWRSEELFWRFISTVVGGALTRVTTPSFRERFLRSLVILLAAV